MKRPADGLTSRIEAREALVGVVGLGYVGLPSAVAFAEAGFRVVGIDLDRERVRAIREGRSYLLDVPSDRMSALVRAKKLRAGSSYRQLADADAVLISVPTPITDGAPDLSSVVASGRSLSAVLRPGTLVVLESTTYPGTTEELLKPILEARGLIAGRDFLLAYSPERIDPGNPTHGFSDIPRIVGGMGRKATQAAAALYEKVVPKVVTVSGPREAELAKLIENTFRHVNIALVNELAVYAHEMDVSIWEAIGAAATKPFGFMPFWPGPGWGGHCIPLDPAYLSWRVRREHAHEIRFVELAHAINAEMPRHVMGRATQLLNERRKSVRGSRILGVGAGYKGRTDDTRGSPGIRILGWLAQQGAVVAYHDPLVAEAEIGGRRLRSVELTERELRKADLVVVFVPQADVDWAMIARAAPVVLDCCNVVPKGSAKLERL
jgi:UDP-N-acetyl-D-glucosamine dehydrogenase